MKATSGKTETYVLWPNRSRWIEAYRADGGGVAILWMGKAGRSKAVPNLRRRPYRITGKVRPECKLRKHSRLRR